MTLEYKKYVDLKKIAKENKSPLDTLSFWNDAMEDIDENIGIFTEEYIEAYVINNLFNIPTG